MKNILFLFTALFSTACHCQTQDIYLHNGDNEWNQKRLDAENNLRYLMERNALMDKQIKENDERIRNAEAENNERLKRVTECQMAVYKEYGFITQFKTVADGSYSIYLTTPGECYSGMAEVKNGQVRSIVIEGKRDVTFPMDIVNQKAKHCMDNIGCMEIFFLSI